MLSRQGVPGLAMLLYFPAGPAYGMGFGSGYNRFFSYDGVQRLAGFSHELAGTGADASWSWTRNLASQLASVTRDNDSFAWTGHYAVQRPYATNGLNQYSQNGSGHPTTFTYDPNGNLIAQAIWDDTGSAYELR